MADNKDTKKKNTRQEQLDADVSEVMETRAGRNVIWAMLTSTGYFDVCEPSVEANGVAKHEAARLVGYGWISSLSQTCPAYVEDMLKEHVVESLTGKES